MTGSPFDRHWAAGLPLSPSQRKDIKMGYQRSGFERIEHIIEAMYELKPGKRLILKFKSQYQLSSERSLVYAKLKHESTTKFFKINQIGPLELMIRRHELNSTEIIPMDDDENLEEIKTFIIDNLIDIENEDIAIELLRKSDLDKTLWTQVIEEWRRVIGGRQRQGQTNSSTIDSCEVPGDPSDER